MAATNPKPSEAADAPWYAAYPAPKSEAATISREEVLAMLKAAPLGSRDFVLVDLRRNDFEGGTIRGSLNLPAQSLYPTLPTVYATLRAAGVRKSLALAGGIKGWAAAGDEYVAWMDGYDAAVWETRKETSR